MATAKTPDDADDASNKSIQLVGNPTVRSLKSGDIAAMLPASLNRASPPSFTPEMALTTRNNSPFTMDFDEYKPSLADQVRIGYFSQDRASQTDSSEIIQMQQMTNVMRQLVSDLETMKRNLHYAKYILRAEYDNQLQERALDLYCRVNDRLLQLEKEQEKKVQIIRRSFRQQLGDAISEVAKQHKNHYIKKRKEESNRNAERLDKAKGDDDEKKKVQQQQETMLELMRMQMREAQERADAQVKEALDREPTPSSIATDPEIYELRDEVENLEKKMDEALMEMEAKANENKRLASDVEDLNEQLQQDKGEIMRLKRELSDSLLTAEQERNRMRSEMERQRVALQNEMEARIQDTKKNTIIKKSSTSANVLLAESQKEVQNLKMLHDQKSKERDLMQKKRLEELSKVEQNEELSENEKDELVKRLQQIEKRQRLEITRLQKELDRANKMWEMKVTILQQTMHALRDESFLRTSLQRQAAKLQHAAVVYASDGPAVIPLSSPHKPSKTFRTLPAIRPGRVEGFGRLLEGKRLLAIDPETPFSEDRPTPLPDDLYDEEQDGQQSQPSESVSLPGDVLKQNPQGCFPKTPDASKQTTPVAMPTEA